VQVLHTGDTQALHRRLTRCAVMLCQKLPGWQARRLCATGQGPKRSPTIVTAAGRTTCALPAPQPRSTPSAKLLVPRQTEEQPDQHVLPRALLARGSARRFGPLQASAAPAPQWVAAKAASCMRPQNCRSQQATERAERRQPKILRRRDRMHIHVTPPKLKRTDIPLRVAWSHPNDIHRLATTALWTPSSAATLRLQELTKALKWPRTAGRARKE